MKQQGRQGKERGQWFRKAQERERESEKKRKRARRDPWRQNGVSAQEKWYVLPLWALEETPQGKEGKDPCSYPAIEWIHCKGKIFSQKMQFT